MPNPFFRFKQFTVFHDRCAMKVTTDGCLFGAWVAQQVYGRYGFLLDIGTGTGLLSLMVAQQSRCSVDAVEVDELAARQASENIVASPWREQIDIHSCNITNYQPRRVYSVVSSNPPFYESELESVNKCRNIAHHSEGLRLGELLKQIGRLLERDGDAYILLPYKRIGGIRTLLQEHCFQIQKEIVVHQSMQHPPFRLMLNIRRSVTAAAQTVHTFIRDEAGGYTDGFINLLHPYYLHL